MSAEEKAIRERILVKWGSMLTHNGWAELLALMQYDLKTDGACSASMHSIDAHYFPKDK